MIRVLLLLLTVALSMAAHAADAQPAAKDPTAFPSTATIRALQIPNYTSPFSQRTNCYILAGETGQAIMIDPCEQLETIAEKKLLVDKETGVATLIETQDLDTYDALARDIVYNPRTGQQRLVYDYFRSTNVYGPQLLALLTEQKLTLKYIVLTHGHLDHIGAAQYLKEHTGAKLLVHAGDVRGEHGAKLAKDAKGEKRYAKDAYRIDGVPALVDQVLQEGDLITLDGMVLQVIHTPGHSPGSICLRTRQEEQTILFSGDTLLHWGYAYDKDGKQITVDTGRTNFLDGSGDQDILYRMIREKLLTLPETTVVLPGHDEVTTIGEEQKYSPARIVPKMKDTPKK